MAISPVGGATNSLAVAGTTLSVSYSPTAGNVVVLFVGFNPSVSSVVVKDNLGNTLTAGPSWGFDASFFQSPVPSGVTGYTITWSGSSVAGCALEEYSGASGALSGSTGNGSGASFSATLNLPNGGDYSVCWMRSNNTPTVTAGTLRQSINYSTLFGRILDATSASSGNVTCTETQTSTFYAWITILVGGPGNVRDSQDVILVAKKPTSALARVAQDLLLTVNKVTSANARLSQDLVLVADKGTPAARLAQEVILVAAPSRHIALWSQDVILVAIQNPITPTITVQPFCAVMT